MNETDTTKQLPEPTFYENGRAPRYINERLKKFDRTRDENTYALFAEWVIL